MKEYQSLSHTRWDCKYHVVFIPKRRKKRVFGVLRRHLGEMFHELASHKEAKIVEGHAWIQGWQSKNRRPISVPLNDTAVAVLERQKGKHLTRVFTYRGKPLNAANTKAWQAALIRAGIENFRWHDLRHTWATWQRQAGTPTHELQRLGGWRTGAMVERYAHLAPDHLALAASRLDGVLGSYDLAT